MQFTENKFQLFLRSEKKHGCLKSCDSKYIIKNLASIKCCTAFLQEWNLSRWNLQYNHKIERRNQEFRQTSKMESFATIINGLWLLTILTKLSILDVCGGQRLWNQICVWGAQPQAITEMRPRSWYFSGGT